MDNLKIFNNESLGLKVRTILNENNSISINAEDTAIGFGWYEVKKGQVYVRWRTINKCLEELGFSQQVAKDDYIPESLFYLLAMKANNENALTFQKWLAIEVIPQIRKTGGYIKEVNQCSIKEIVKETICQVVPEIIRELEDKEERNKRAERELKKLETATKKKIERLLYSERYSYYEISKLLGQEEIDVSAEAICFYAQNIGL